MMSTSASLPSVVKPSFIEPVGERAKLPKVDARKLCDTPDNAARKLVQGVGLHQQQCGTCTQHNQALCPNLQ
jgi:hypothetical protein